MAGVPAATLACEATLRLEAIHWRWSGLGLRWFCGATKPALDPASSHLVKTNLSFVQGAAVNSLLLMAGYSFYAVSITFGITQSWV